MLLGFVTHVYAGTIGPAAPAPVAAGKGSIDAAAAGVAATAEGTTVRAPVKHVLSQELQLYFDKVPPFPKLHTPAHLSAARKLWGGVIMWNMLAELRCTVDIRTAAGNKNQLSESQEHWMCI